MWGRETFLENFLLYMNDVIIPISLISKGYIVLQNTQRIVQSIRNPEFSRDRKSVV